MMIEEEKKAADAVPAATTPEEPAAQPVGEAAEVEQAPVNEEKQEAADVVPAEVTPEETAPPPVEEAAEVKQAAAAAKETTAEPELKKKKIRRMLLAEVNKRLEQSTLRMGGDSSLYVRHLLARKKELEQAGSGD